MKRRETFSLAGLAALMAVLPQEPDLSPPPGYPSDKLEAWKRLLDTALKPDAPQRLLRRLERVQVVLLQHPQRVDHTIPMALASLERVVQIRGLNMPSAYEPVRDHVLRMYRERVALVVQKDLV